MKFDLKSEALTFFDQLEKFSLRYAQEELRLPTTTSPWGYHAYSDKTPMGAILHYTADEDFHRVLRWFLDANLNARASAHVVIADRRLGMHEKLATDLPMIRDLPTTVIQTRRPYTTAWHATWVNSVCYGIENVNAGPLRVVKPPTSVSRGKFTTWRRRGVNDSEWTAPWNVPYKSPVKLYGRWWAPYTADQVVSNILVLRYVQDLFGTLRRPWILGHEQVQKSKQDPGPTFPLHGIREAVFEGYRAIRRKPWFRLFDMDRYAGRTERDGIVIEWAKLSDGAAPNPTPVEAWARFDAEVRALPGEPGKFGSVGKTALRLLGYHVGDLAGELVDEDLVSIGIFQKMAGLRTDSHPGLRTKEALVSRLVKKRFLDPEIIS